MTAAFRRGLYILVVCAVSAVFWILDHQPEFYMGDSGSYLLTAVQGYIPPDRSFVYGFLIQLIALPFHSLKPLLIMQGLAGILSCLGLWICLKLPASLKHSEHSYFLIALLFSIEPMHMLLQRYVLTEAFTMPVFIAYLMAGLSYMKNGRLRNLLILQVLGVVLISLRLIFLPLVLANAVILPVLAWFETNRHRGRHYSAALAHLGISLMCIVALHGSYRLLYGKLSHAQPAYTYWDGFVQVSAWAPAVTEKSAANPQVAEIIRQGKEYDLNEFSRRYYQLWDREGLVFRIKSIAPDSVTANGWAKITARNALMQDPAAVMIVGLKTYLEFNTYPKILNQLNIDRGDDRPVSTNLVARLENYFRTDTIEFDRKGNEYWQKPSLIKNIQGHAGPWMLLLAQTPYICLLAGIFQKRVRTQCLYLSFVSFIYLATVCLLSPLVITRLLYPLTIPFFLSAGWLLADWNHRRIEQK